MSYCVNCGVELDKTAKKCPLCGVEIVNPLQPQDTISPTPYPNQTVSLSKTDRRYAVQLLSIMLALASAICIILNLIYSRGTSWSVYPVGTFVLVFMAIVPPLLFKASTIKFISLDVALILLYLFLIDKFCGVSGWFSSIALPIVLYAFVAFAILYFYILIKQPDKLLFTAVLIILSGFLALCVDISINIYLNRLFKCSWSLIVLTCCIALAFALYATNRNMRIRNELHKRLHL
jgi:hypothetical protein